MRKAQSQAFFSGAFHHSLPLALLWLAGVEKMFKRIFEFVHICGAVCYEVETDPASSLGERHAIHDFRNELK